MPARPASPTLAPMMPDTAVVAHSGFWQLFSLTPDGGRVEAAGRRCYRPGMGDAAFDALAVTRHFKARGFDFDQVEAIAEAMLILRDLRPVLN